MLRQPSLVLFACLALPAFADDSLVRPDPGIGDGFANLMAEQFMDDHDMARAEADCLVYEVMEQARAEAFTRTMDDIAAELADSCRAE